MLEEIAGGFFESIGWGIGGAAVATALFIGGPRAKPVMKNVIKGYLGVTHRVRTAAAEASETIQDLYAEAKHEYESQLRPEARPQTETEESGATRIPIENVETSA